MFVLKSELFNKDHWEAMVPQSLRLPLQTKILPPPQSKVLWTKERDDIRPQTSQH